MRIRSGVIAIALAMAGICGTTAAIARSTGGGGWGSGGSDGSGSGSTSHASSKGPTVKLAHSSVGSILVDSKGFTLYLFTADKKNSDHCVKVAGCLSAWPALTVSGKPTAGPGVKASLLGTITIKGGKKQVTYNGWPLYLYVNDSSPASTSYVGVSGFGGTWDAVSKSGTAVK
jgi:predicted lipoprotein with Yx(FWY)xxD motif